MKLTALKMWVFLFFRLIFAPRYQLSYVFKKKDLWNEIVTCVSVSSM